MMHIESIPGVSFFLRPETRDQLEFELSPEQQAKYELKPLDAKNDKRDTKTKGDLSELYVALAFAAKGFLMSKPIGENSRYDFIADDGEKLLRVQVKTGRIRGAVLMFSCCSTHGHRRSAVKSRSNQGQIELLAVYCPDNGKVYIVPEAEMTRTHMYLRLAPPRNNMVKTIRWAAQYELP
ncbi:MAG TPA: group I intron-associated PD-(D/E)XK endonuclease [Candidatus Elarobacter sp.]|nr:group I intron-associated PD-(D/E)XK endonuclease [Candidatus Elarobacter sp.]